jgi:hypothetical protein
VTDDQERDGRSSGTTSGTFVHARPAARWLCLDLFARVKPKVVFAVLSKAFLEYFESERTLNYKMTEMIRNGPTEIQINIILEMNITLDSFPFHDVFLSNMISFSFQFRNISLNNIAYIKVLRIIKVVVEIIIPLAACTRPPWSSGFCTP